MVIWLRVPLRDAALLVFAMGLVWTMELINTAIEATVDLASPQIQPLAKVAKDVSAAGVLASAITAVLVGLMILGPPLLKRVVGILL